MSTSSSSDSFHAQLAAVIEVLANTAVAEICKLVDDGYAVLRLEITQNQREIDGLRRKLLVAKFQTSRRNNHHLDRLSALRRSSTLQVTRGPSAPSRDRCNPATKSSTQGTRGEEEGAGFPVILKVEGGVNTFEDIQAPEHGSETHTSAPTNTVEPENHLHHVAQKFTTCDNGNVNRDSHHPSFERNNRFTTTSHDGGNLFNSTSKWAEAGAGIEAWNNAGSLTTGNCSLDPLHNPHQEGRTGSNPDSREGYSGALEEEQGGEVSCDPSNAAPSLAGNLDRVHDMVVVEDSVPIKVEADMSSDWSITDRDGMTRSAKQRLQKHGRGEELEERHSTLTVSTEALDRTTGLKSSSVVLNSGTSNNGLSSFSAMETPKQVVNREGNQLFSLRCELCGKTFGNVRNLRLHQRVHTGEKPYSCRHCSKRFSRQQQMKTHERVHTGEKPFRCPICGRCFLDSSNMRRHSRLHT